MCQLFIHEPAKEYEKQVTETVEDDPAGRRANRRTEIYLDF